jgi:hypothetical protein
MSRTGNGLSSRGKRPDVPPSGCRALPCIDVGHDTPVHAVIDDQRPLVVHVVASQRISAGMQHEAGRKSP